MNQCNQKSIISHPKGTYESHLEGVLQLELRVRFIGAEESQDVVALQHAERLQKLLAGDVGSSLRAAVPVEVLHELLQKGSLPVFGLAGQQHRLGELCYILDALLGGRRTTGGDDVQVDDAGIGVGGGFERR